MHILILRVIAKEQNISMASKELNRKVGIKEKLNEVNERRGRKTSMEKW